MSRDNSTSLSENKFLKAKNGPQHLTREEFGKRLYSLMLERGWTQAELARRSGVLRDSVSRYIRGSITPTARNVEKLAKALGVEPVSVYPNYAEKAIATDDAPTFDLKTSTTNPGKAWVRVNRLVNFPTAIKIGELLQADDAADRD